MGAHQRSAAGRRHLIHLIGRVKSRDVPGDVPAQPGDEARDVAQFLRRIVQARDNQRGQLQPDTPAVHVLDGIQHRLQPGFTLLFVKLVAEGLQVDIDGVQVFAEHIEGCRRCIAIAHHHAADAMRRGQYSRIVEVFKENSRFIVGVGDRGDTPLHAEPHDLLWHQLIAIAGDLILSQGTVVLFPQALAQRAAHLRDVPVLAKATPKVAADGADGKDVGARQEVIERFFLDGVNMGCRRPPISQEVQLASLVLPDAADASLSFLDDTSLLAGFAADGTVAYRLVQARFLQRHFVQSCFEHGEVWFSKNVTPSEMPIL